ncbi:WYL domain-containing protein [Sphingomonas sp. 2R-10]|uniref:helix-turn-helix transcriptional regulator n=1 Tax=Sphingomonas sp. 2R-10 TaxID=3045148 RepID=UPI000F7BA7DE|nr:WYL domain-containing protein [Sphingomonas sp. 2R-10]MDJ0278813.1 WYL domain-containing protein [Sphingomonas sp. 2R-10]
MTERMAKLDRLLALVHALSETTEGLTLDEMAERLGVNRRTAERMRDIIANHFDLDEIADDRRKRFLIRDSLRRAYTRPTPGEVAALQAEVEGQRAAGKAARASQLGSLLAKVKGALDDREKRRIDPDLDALVRLQRTLVTAGPIAAVAPETVAIVQSAILAGRCVEFHYATDDRPEPRWRRMIPYGLVHGPLTYLLGKMPGRDDQPVYFRLDRMMDAEVSNTLGCAPDDWDIDAWLAESFAVWRDEKQDVTLCIPPSAAARARRWRFHRLQQVEELDDGGLRIRFTTGGMRELAEHLFTWGGELVIEGPGALIDVMRERIDAAQTMLPQIGVRPLLSQQPAIGSA